MLCYGRNNVQCVTTDYFDAVTHVNQCNDWLGVHSGVGYPVC